MSKKMIRDETLMIFREFVGDNWSFFIQHCNNHDIDETEAKEIYSEIEGEN